MFSDISFDKLSLIMIIITIIIVILYAIASLFIESILDDDIEVIHFKLPKKRKRSKSL